jgi:hypothetical protein
MRGFYIYASFLLAILTVSGVAISTWAPGFNQRMAEHAAKHPIERKNH